jgi:NTE family protein
MRKQLAFVLGGGGARGALQVGALRALVEGGYSPDLLIGTSVGAVNAAFLGINGVSLESIQQLAEAWRSAIAADLLPANFLWLTVRALFSRPSIYPTHRMRDFFIRHGCAPEVRFRDLQGPRLVLVAADLNTGRPILFGTDLQETVLEGILASTALPPWVSPLPKEGQLLIDGGVVSTLPVEPAISLGATEIIALDLADQRSAPPAAPGFGAFVYKLIVTMEKRQADLELRLAEARGVPVRRIILQGESPVQMWDFNHTEALIDRGYELTRRAMANWPVASRSPWRQWAKQLGSRLVGWGLPR